MEYELLDTGVFNEDRYFDVFIEYAKAGPEDILVRITAVTGGRRQQICICCLHSGSETIGRHGLLNRTELENKPVIRQIKSKEGTSAVWIPYRAG